VQRIENEAITVRYEEVGSNATCRNAIGGSESEILGTDPHANHRAIMSR
ncbi:hypothetical protein Tco_1489015, partial [Tanacetum coccineum]